MPSLKEVRNRIKSVQSTQQITKAMKMVAAAKLRKAQDATIQSRPYALELDKILKALTLDEEILKSNIYTTQREPQKIALIVITADRGLCGPFNTNIIKAVNSLLVDKYSEQLKNNNVTFICIGKKGLEYFSKRYKNVVSEHAHLFYSLNFDTARVAAEQVLSSFISGKYDRVELVYNEFKNVASQVVKKEYFLPAIPQESGSLVSKTVPVQYIFEPSVEGIVNDIVPKLLKMKFFRALLESNASFYGAQMTAMEKATENAGELLKELKITYNRTRQASITKEILEIVGGAEAMAAG